MTTGLLEWRKAAATLSAIALVAAALAAAGCGKESEPQAAERQPFSLTLDSPPNPNHAGIYTGAATGVFEEAGLDLEIDTPTDPADPIEQVAAGQTDLAIAGEPDVILARDQGLDVVAVGALVDEPLTSMVWLQGSGIREVSDLRGRMVAIAGPPYQDAYLDAILAEAGVSRRSVERVSVGPNPIPAILGGRADALLGASRNIEGVELRRRGRDPTVLPVDRLGIPTYDELVLVASSTAVEERPEEIRLFISALRRGTEAAVSDPEAAARDVLGANEALDPELTRARIDATLPLLDQSGDEQPFGYMDPARWERFIGWMRDQGLIDSLPEPSEAIDDGLLPDGPPGE